MRKKENRVHFIIRTIILSFMVIFVKDISMVPNVSRSTVMLICLYQCLDLVCRMRLLIVATASSSMSLCFTRVPSNKDSPMATEWSSSKTEISWSQNSLSAKLTSSIKFKFYTVKPATFILVRLTKMAPSMVITASYRTSNLKLGTKEAFLIIKSMGPVKNNPLMGWEKANSKTTNFIQVNLLTKKDQYSHLAINLSSRLNPKNVAILSTKVLNRTVNSLEVVLKVLAN